MTDKTVTTDDAADDIAEATIVDLAPVDPDAVQASDVEKYLATIDRLPVEDPEAVAMEIVSRRLAASNVADLLSPMEVQSARDLPRVPLRVTAVHFNRSAFEGTAGVYAIIDATNMDTGTMITVSCGAADVLAQLYKLVEWKALPIELQFVPSQRATASGYYPLHLEAVPPRVT